MPATLPDPAPSPDASPDTARRTLEGALRALRDDHRNVALPGLVACFLALAGLLALPLVWRAWWIPLVLAVPVGVLQYHVVISGHEAVHRTLCWPARLNDALGAFGQALVGVNFASYRVQHLEHHRAACLADDPDGHVYGPVVRARPGFARWAVLVLGVVPEIAVKILQKGAGSVGTRGMSRSSVRTRGLSRRHTAYVLLAQAVLFLLLWRTTGRITGYLELWLLPLFGVAVLLNRVRIFVEHGVALQQREEHLARGGRGLPTVDVPAPAWQRLLFAPFHFNHHAGHHLHMQVPHYNLPRLADLLRRHRVQGFHEVEGGYLRVIARAMVAPTPGEP